jgi:PIN domain nuclease of toxin-antitoxin system
MNLILLDSHVVLWAVVDSRRIGKRARQLISSGAELHVSTVSLLELTIKAMRGKIALPEKFVSRLVDEAGMSLLNLTCDHVEAVREFPELSAHDPFDRTLVAQASQSGLRLLTADRMLLGLGRDFIVDATA